MSIVKKKYLFSFLYLTFMSGYNPVLQREMCVINKTLSFFKIAAASYVYLSRTNCIPSLSEQ